MMEAAKQARSLERFASGEDPFKESIYGVSRWASPDKDYLQPVQGTVRHYSKNRSCIEIGAGGGRWTQFFDPSCRSLTIFEGTEASKQLLEKTVKVPFDFHVCLDGWMPQYVADKSADFIFSFDVMVHFHPELLFTYLYAASKVVKNHGIFCFSYGRKYPNHKLFSEAPVGNWYYYDGYGQPIETYLRAVGFQVIDYVDFPGGWGSRFVTCRKQLF